MPCCMLRCALVVRSVLPCKSIIHMVPRPNLGGDSISFPPWSTRLRYTPPSHYAYNGDSAGDRKFDSNVSYFLILIKACSILVCTSFIWFFCLFTSGGDEWEDDYAPFKTKSFEVHHTNSQSMLLPMMGFKYVNSLPPIHKGPFRLSFRIMTHLIMSDLLICPFSSTEPTHT